MHIKQVKRTLTAIVMAAVFSVSAAANEAEGSQVELVGDIKGTQITGVTVSNDGRVFVNAPNWRDGVRFSVAQVTDTGEFVASPIAKQMSV